MLEATGDQPLPENTQSLPWSTDSRDPGYTVVGDLVLHYLRGNAELHRQPVDVLAIDHRPGQPASQP